MTPLINRARSLPFALGRLRMPEWNVFGPDLARDRSADFQFVANINYDADQNSLIVFQRQDLFRAEYRDFFPGPWEEVEARCIRAVHDLENNQLDWKYVEEAGLVRDSLQFKRNMLTQAIKQGVVGRLLKIINSILGSLSKALPVLEAVKEYKEHVEAAIAVQNRWK